jgi:sec-independent protein translocase protein TatA
MGSFSWWHWVLLLVVVMVVFGGKGKVSDLMGDVAKGIKSFKKGMADDPTEDAMEDVKTLEKTAEPGVKSPAKKVKT